MQRIAMTGIAAVVVTLVVSACGPERQSASPFATAPLSETRGPATVTTPAEPLASTPELSAPQVTISADPPPPFTYWAPEGATIRNHPHNPGVWLAFVGGRQVSSYYGDGCGASRDQVWVGLSVDALPPATAGRDRRVFAEGTPVNEDLRSGRTNVAFDPRTRRVVSVACY